MRLNLRRLGLLSGKAARVFAARAGLTPQRVDLMLLLRGWWLSQKEIAERLCVVPSVISRIVDALVDLGLVVRVCQVDRRHRYPRLTHLGLRRLALCFPEPTRHGAQDHGEITWLHRWREFIADLGIRVDSVLRSRTPATFGTMATKRELVPDWLLYPWKFPPPI